MAMIGLEALTEAQAKALELTYVNSSDDSSPRIFPNHYSLVLTHIPRTGGVTLDTILFAVAAATKRSWIRLQGDAYAQYWGGTKVHVLDSVKLNLENLRTAVLISGHMPYGIHHYVENACVYATVLRDPVMRGWSQIRRIARDDPLIASLSVPTILKRGYIVDNQQVRMIAGCTDASVPCDDEMYRVAVNVLEQSYALVGTMDEFDRFVGVLATGLGWPPLLFRQRNSSQALTSHPSAEDGHLLLEHSIYDDKLYRHASEIRQRKEEEFLMRYKTQEHNVPARDDTVLFSIEPYSIGGQSVGLLPKGQLDAAFALVRQHGAHVRTISL